MLNMKASKLFELSIESTWLSSYELADLKGKLAVIDNGKGLSGYIDLWILEQTPNREWERHIISYPSIATTYNTDLYNSARTALEDCIRELKVKCVTLFILRYHKKELEGIRNQGDF